MVDAGPKLKLQERERERERESVLCAKIKLLSYVGRRAGTCQVLELTGAQVKVRHLCENLFEVAELKHCSLALHNTHSSNNRDRGQSAYSVSTQDGCRACSLSMVSIEGP